MAQNLQVYISSLFRAARQSIHAQSQPPSPVLSLKLERVESIPDTSVLSETDQLREEIKGLRESRDDERAQFFTSLEQVTRERNKYHVQAEDWEEQALNAVAKLQQARELVGDLTPLVDHWRDMAAPRDCSLPPSSPPADESLRPQSNKAP
ncbi:hypothetical protein C8J57DRAFT_1518020 [Mycena rebaudengoi]|nr:hypothetical protein C8J57DRAFT_1518020 [Mycena rebaudengoi]